MPDLGEGLADAEIVAWHVVAGDVVALNQVLAEVETEKAVVELPSPFAGTVVELLAAPGETVAVGAPIVTIETAASDGSGDERTEDRPRPDGYPHSSATARPKRYRAGGRVAVDRCATSTPATRRPIRLPRRFRPRRRRKSPAPDPGRPTSPARPLAAPPVRFTARQEGVDLADVVGHGPGGIITRDDLAAYLGSRAPGGRRTRQRPATPSASRPKGRVPRCAAFRSGWRKPWCAASPKRHRRASSCPST